MNICEFDKKFIETLSRDKARNLKLLLSGKIYEFFEIMKKYVYAVQVQRMAAIGGYDIECCFNAVNGTTAAKFMGEIYMNPETNSLIEEDNTELSHHMLQINCRKPTTNITTDTFNATASMKKICELDLDVIMDLAHKDLALKGTKLYTVPTDNSNNLNNLNNPNNKKLLFTADEAYAKAREFMQEKTFTNFKHRSNLPEYLLEYLPEDDPERTSNQNGTFKLNFQEKWNWNLFTLGIKEWFYRLFGFGTQRMNTRYFEIKCTPNNVNDTAPGLICVYLVWGLPGRTTVLDYKIANDRISRAELVVNANSVEVLVHELYHCLQFAEILGWKIPTDCVEYGAICLEREFRRKETKDYVIFRQYLQIAYGIADWSDTAEEFDKKFNSVLDLGKSAHFSRQFVPRLTMGKYYYAYSLGFMNNLTGEIMRTLRKYSP